MALKAGIEYDRITVKHEIKLCQPVPTDAWNRDALPGLTRCNDFVRDLKDHPYNDRPSGGTTNRISASEIYLAYLKIEDYPGSGYIEMIWGDADKNREIYRCKYDVTARAGNPTATWWYWWVYSFSGYFPGEIDHAGQYYVQINTSWGSALIWLAVLDSRVPPKKYRCSGAPEYKCVEDPAGPYASLEECRKACTAPPPPPPPPPVEECGPLDIPCQLRRIVRSLLDFPAKMWDFCFDKMAERWISQAAPGWAALEARMDEANPAWREEFKKMGLSKSPIEPTALIAIAGIFGFSLGFLGTPFMKSGATKAWELFPWNVPGTSDLVRFQLREVFDPVLRAQQLIPPPSLDYYTHMRKNGFDQFWADSYWAAHWELPSVSEAYEMFARLRPEIYKAGTPQGDRVLDTAKTLGMDPKTYKPSFELGELTKLMTRQDKMQVYIPQLAEIAYLPLTRVDVRRMYGLGVLDANGVYNAYLDLRYSPENAARLRDFTVKYEAPEERRAKELTLTDQEKLYASGKRTEAQFKGWMDKVGYGPDAIKDELDVLSLVGEKVEKVKRPKELSLTDWEKLIYEAKLPWSEIKARMIELGYSTRAQKDELMIVQLEATKKWSAAYLARTITLDELKKRLKTVELTDKEIADLLAKLKLGA